jgi:hypothetical protein
MHYAISKLSGGGVHNFSPRYYPRKETLCWGKGNNFLGKRKQIAEVWKRFAAEKKRSIYENRQCSRVNFPFKF